MQLNAETIQQELEKAQKLTDDVETSIEELVCN